MTAEESLVLILVNAYEHTAMTCVVKQVFLP